MSQKLPDIEQQLIAGCLAGERIAQRQLFLKYKDAMFTILYRMLNDEAEATDALQETFIAVFRGLSSFNNQSTLGAWIKTITVRTGIATLRKQSRFDMFSVDVLKEEPIVWPSELSGETLEKAIAQLSDGYRNVFLLIEVEGYTHKEVGEMLSISEGTSKSQLYHAKKHLKRLLKENRDER